MQNKQKNKFLNIPGNTVQNEGLYYLNILTKNYIGNEVKLKF